MPEHATPARGMDATGLNELRRLQTAAHRVPRAAAHVGTRMQLRGPGDARNPCREEASGAAGRETMVSWPVQP